MVGLSLHLEADVSIEVNGRDAIELEDTLVNTDHDAPYSCYRLIEVEERGEFSVNIRLSDTFRRLVDHADRGIMILIQMDGLEVLRRLVSQNGFSTAKTSDSLPLNYQGIVDWSVGETSRLRKFQFKGVEDGEGPATGLIRVEFFLVKLLGPPEQDELSDYLPMEELFRGISLSTGERMYLVTIPVRVKVEKEKDLMDFGDTQMHPERMAMLATRSEQSEDEDLMKYSSSPVPKPTPKPLGLPHDTRMTLLEDDSNERMLDQAYAPLEPLSNIRKKVDVQSIYHDLEDEGVSFQSTDVSDIVTSRKRSAHSAFGDKSPLQPSKIMALEYEEPTEDSRAQQQEPRFYTPAGPLTGLNDVD
ncbi:hypothetical protein CCHR01_13341 [Colletotrichum chrysophilum]|uniref:DUF7918 domain-containing protein n=1 Tax=Colletotrichum chrysophilum TaxID=1836956 RepID=A0AAD9A9L9_9PEZI|nr:hypothetical protein CCHR01_13341 [Colletotrichum chrysophilum]